MSMLRFELRKLWRQKKILWLFLLVFVCSGVVWAQNLSQQSLVKERAQEQIAPMVKETDDLYRDLKLLEREGNLDELQAKQLEHVNSMANAFFQWKSAIYDERWQEIPGYEYEFLTNVQQFEQVGGMFRALQGSDRDKAIQKNDWLRAHDLAYEDEVSSLAPALFIKKSTAILLGVASVVVLLLLFGATLTVEHEQRTWLTLRTQPMTNRRRIVGKYISLLVVLVVFLAIVLGVGLLIPLAFGYQTMNFQYPQLMTAGDAFIFISTAHYVTRAILLFVCASIVVFSLILLISTRVKNSFITMVLTGAILLVGFAITETYPVLQFALNPFQYLRFSQVLEVIPQSTDGIYLLGAILWSGLFLVGAILLPERETGLFQSVKNNQPFRGGEIKTKSHPIVKMIIFEWRKMKRQGLMKQLGILLLLFVVIGYLIISQQAQQQEVAYIDSLQREAEQTEHGLIAMLEEMSAEYRETARVADESGDEAMSENFTYLADGSDETVEFFHTLVDRIQMALTAYDEQEWQPFYDYQLFQNQYDNGEFNSDTFSNLSVNTYGALTMKASMVEKEWLKAHHIQPVFSGAYIPTIYQYWGDNLKEKKQWQEANRKVDNSGLFSLYLYFDSYLYFVPMVLLFFLVGAGFVGERDKRETLRLLKTQPIAEKHIFLGKISHALLTVVLGGPGIFGWVVLVATVLNRFGDWNYPILHYDSKSVTELPTYTGIRAIEGGFHFVSLGDYVVESVVLLLAVLVFFIVLSIFISLFVRSPLGVFSTVLAIGSAGYFASVHLLPDMAHLSPFTYLNVAKITNGEVATLLNNSGIHVLTGGVVLLVAMVLLVVVGYLLLNGRGKK
ncbi:ABC transporter permease subunit [Sporosarcina sp. FSL K6-3457]|uniref:ABC transporter permease subunit n=1 Tax=Sporosarcina sp. FSL K6-3457 TaxID=2978204 RepID=UPI0030F80021